MSMADIIIDGVADVATIVVDYYYYLKKERKKREKREKMPAMQMHGWCGHH